jgi:hypothetical protein
MENFCDVPDGQWAGWGGVKAGKFQTPNSKFQIPKFKF